MLTIAKNLITISFLTAICCCYCCFAILSKILIDIIDVSPLSPYLEDFVVVTTSSYCFKVELTDESTSRWKHQIVSVLEI